MTAVTHQLFALLVALWVLTRYPVSLVPAVATVAIIAVMVGALTPDLDQPTANLWRRLLGGRALGRIFQTFSGGHRHLTHSLIGIGLIAWLLNLAIYRYVHPAMVSSALIIWRAYLIGYISHPIADTLTDRGVPWLWPLKFHLRIPPGPDVLRVTTASLVETVLVRGGIVAAALLLLTAHGAVVMNLFRG